MPVKAFSYGGGTQSTAALVLAAEGKLDYRTFLFANVGEDSERPATLAYVREIAEPFAALAGIEYMELRKRTRDGKPQTLMQKIDASERSIPIPVRMGERGAPGNRTCTAEFKIRVIEKELRQRGATKDEKAVVGIGITTDELGRVGSEIDPRSPYQLRKYPLFELGLSRQDCRQIILGAGLPMPKRASSRRRCTLAESGWAAASSTSPKRASSYAISSTETRSPCLTIQTSIKWPAAIPATA